VDLSVKEAAAKPYPNPPDHPAGAVRQPAAPGAAIDEDSYKNRDPGQQTCTLAGQLGQSGIKPKISTAEH
jgi:hypothetical protein